MRNGVRARLHRRLRPFVRPSLPVSSEDREWLHSKLREHAQAGAIEAASCLDFVANAFIVRSGAARKRRLVIDLRDLNDASTVPGVRFEDIRHLRTMLRPRDFMFSIDLESAFHHVPIAQASRKYFTFHIGGMCFQCSAIPFGWSLSPLIFTKVMRPFTRFLRNGDCSSEPLTTPPPPDDPGLSTRPSRAPTLAPRPLPRDFVRDPEEAAELTATPEDFRIRRGGLRCLIYLDDLIVMASSAAEARAASAFVRRAVRDSGLSVNDAKCNWDPAQRLTHLGTEIDTVRGTFKVPPARASAIRSTAHHLLSHAASHRRWVPARTLAKLLGLAASSTVAVLPARLLSRSAFDDLAALPFDVRGRRRWDTDVRLSSTTLTDVRAWAAFSYSHHTNGRAIWPPSTTTRTLHTDASTFAWGAVLDAGAQSQTSRGYFDAQDRRLHITALEALAVERGWEAFADSIRGETVAVYIDSSAVEYALRKGSSRSPTLMPIVRRVWQLWAASGATVLVRPVRSKDNPADEPSRYIDRDDWMLNRDTFRALEMDWGVRHDVDLFASATNRLVPRFASRWPHPEAAAVDAFAIRWDQFERCWINPPWDFIPKVLRKLRLEQATATVLTPLWPTASWWPDLTSLARRMRVFNPEPGSFLPGHLGSAIPVGSPRWRFVATDIAPLVGATR